MCRDGGICISTRKAHADKGISMKRRVLYKNAWFKVTLLEYPMPDGTESPYVSISNNPSVAILPYKTIRKGSKVATILLREEIVPPWLVDSQEARVTTMITGQIEVGEDSVEAAVRELYEEAGYQVGVPQMLCLGTARGSKLLEAPVHIYAVDVTGLVPESPPVDGSAFERYSSNVWYGTLALTDDAFAHLAWARLQRYLGGPLALGLP